jgi:hypothetical protein
MARGFPTPVECVDCGRVAIASGPDDLDGWGSRYEVVGAELPGGGVPVRVIGSTCPDCTPDDAEAGNVLCERCSRGERHEHGDGPL